MFVVSSSANACIQHIVGSMPMYQCTHFTQDHVVDSENSKESLDHWWIALINTGHPCFQAEPTTKVFVTRFAPVLLFIHFHLGIYLNQHTKLITLSRPFRENGDKTLALPSRWPIIDNRNNLYKGLSELHVVWQTVQNSLNTTVTENKKKIRKSWRYTTYRHKFGAALQHIGQQSYSCVVAD